MEPISKINASRNELFYRGINAVDLAREFDYETVFYLLLHGSLPFQAEYDEFVEKLIRFRSFYTEDMNSLTTVAKRIGKFQETNSLDNYDTLLAFVSLSALVTAKSCTQISESKTQPPSKDLKFVPNFLWQIFHNNVSDQDIHEFENCLILHMDDPDNPSLASLTGVLYEGGSISQALCAALDKHVDKLHHGAGTEAMKMFLEFRDAGSETEYLRGRILDGKKIFGLGHRIYTGLDPRATVLKALLKQRTTNSAYEWITKITEKVEFLSKNLLLEIKGVSVFPNVDFYNAATYLTFGFPYEFNTELFALARVAGWSAHIFEILKE